MTRVELEAVVKKIVARCVRVGECLVWIGSKTTPNGYGQITVNKQRVLIHRLVYEHAHGPIPEGLVIDHVVARGCCHPACCNPSHLEAVTERENILRGRAPAAHNARKTHCIKGHALVAGNLASYPLGKGARQCIQCQRVHNRAARARARGREVAPREASCRRCGATYTRRKRADYWCSKACKNVVYRASNARRSTAKVDSGLCVRAGCGHPHCEGRRMCAKHLQISRCAMAAYKAARRELKAQQEQGA